MAKKKPNKTLANIAAATTARRKAAKAVEVIRLAADNAARVAIELADAQRIVLEKKSEAERVAKVGDAERACRAAAEAERIAIAAKNAKLPKPGWLRSLFG